MYHGANAGKKVMCDVLWGMNVSKDAKFAMHEEMVLPTLLEVIYKLQIPKIASRMEVY